MSIEDRNKALDKLSLNNIEIRDFIVKVLIVDSPLFRLGVGKTLLQCSLQKQFIIVKVMILSKTSLEDNFNDGIPLCGADYMTKNNHWVFCKCNTDEEKQLSKIYIFLIKLLKKMEECS